MTLPTQWDYHPRASPICSGQETGETPQHYLESLRMRRAADLLLRTGFSIKQIAAATGFESPFYFSQRFKAWTQEESDRISPGQMS